MHSGPDPAVAPEHYPADDTIVSVYIEENSSSAGGMMCTPHLVA